MIPPDLSPLRDLLAGYRPHFSQADFRPAFRWIEAGCDLERDVLPVVRHWTSKKPDIFSAGFFTPHVLAAKETRLKAERDAQARGTPDGLRRRAEGIAYLTRRLGRRMPTDERWLAAYEARHGAVEIGTGA